MGCLFLRLSVCLCLCLSLHVSAILCLSVCLCLVASPYRLLNQYSNRSSKRSVKQTAHWLINNFRVFGGSFREVGIWHVFRTVVYQFSGRFFSIKNVKHLFV